MILIKDRHTPVSVTNLTFIPGNGKYDTYKGSTRARVISSNLFFSLGKYDTYKGSTPIWQCVAEHCTTDWGNMILIKDRHS